MRLYQKADEPYQTQPWVIHRLLDLYLPPEPVLEPSAGRGNLVRALEERGYAVEDFDIRTGHDIFRPHIAEPTTDAPLWGCLLTNPPYAVAERYVWRAFDFASEVCLLLRLDFLGSQERHRLWCRHPLTALVTLSDRPGFGFESAEPVGTDRYNYAWFIWSSDEWFWHRQPRLKPFNWIRKPAGHGKLRSKR